MSLKSFFGKNKHKQAPRVFNVDNEGNIIVSTTNNNNNITDIKIHRGKGYCYNCVIKTIHNNNAPFSICVINNPINSNFKIYVYNLIFDVLNGKSCRDYKFNIYIVNNITNPQSIDYNPLIIGDSQNDNLIFNKWDTIDHKTSAIYSRIDNINTKGITNYNYNFIDDMLEIPEGRAIVLKMQLGSAMSMTGLNSVLTNIKFVKIPNNEIF